MVDGRERATDHRHEEKSEVPLVAWEKLLAVLGNLSERMSRVEFSQFGQAARHRKDSAESSVIGSNLGVGTGMNLRL